MQTQRMRKLIRETLLDLLDIRPLERISVIDIVEAAQISRSTFYRYYKDIYELFYDCALVYNAGLDRNEPLRGDGLFFAKLYENIRRSFEMAAEHESFHREEIRAKAMAPAGYLEWSMSDTKEHIATVLKEMGLNEGNCLGSFDFAVTFLQSLFAESLNDWIARGRSVPIDEAVSVTMLLYFRIARSFRKCCPLEDFGHIL